eukprot:COSAG02_NODE_6637_length_3445_cov_15.508747_2_plen_50_part_00
MTPPVYILRLWLAVCLSVSVSLSLCLSVCLSVSLYLFVHQGGIATAAWR